MSIVEKLATSLGRKDEVPNQELAKEIVDKKDKNAVKELVAHLNDKGKDIPNDCIKVLYEISNTAPTLLAPHIDELIAQLDSKNNRMQWGAMTAINSITTTKPAEVYNALGKLANIADKGSVITKDNYVGILVKLADTKNYKKEALQLLHEQIQVALPNQLPMYAEQALSVIVAAFKQIFINTLTQRLDDLEKESKRKRVEKVIKKLSAA